MQHTALSTDESSRGRIAFAYRGYENIGIQSLSAVLKEAGFSTKLFFDPELFDDWILRVPSLIRYFDYSERLIEQIVAWKPFLVLFSVVTYDYRWALGIAERLKERCDATIVFGGIHPTSVPEAVLKNRSIDFVVQGEGERAMAALAEQILQGSSPEEGIANVWRKQDGRIVPPKELSPLIQDLDALPFPDKELHRRAAEHFRIGYTTISGRGCPGNCTYCHNNIQKKLYPLKGYMRRRSPENVIEELAERKAAYAYDFIRFSDDNFCYDVDWLESFSELYREKIGVPFWIFIHPSSSNQRIVNALKKAGCTEVEMGIQTLDPRIRNDVIHRHESDQEIIQTITLLREAGIRCSTDFIINLPGHTEDALIHAVRFFTRNTPDRVNTFWINYYPGLDISEKAMESNLFDEGVMENICAGEGVHTFFQGGTVYDSHLAKLQVFFTLFQVLPNRIIEGILSRKLYRLVPFLGFKITYFLMYTVSYMSKGEKNDLYLRRFKLRYRNYMAARVRKSFR